ncbi:snare associated Golgi protein-domain-containing protein [Chytridium lagenaria]|nr:snare associated Golgi protein-domain-containing protein [Chytridium lagenaria]
MLALLHRWRHYLFGACIAVALISAGVGLYPLAKPHILAFLEYVNDHKAIGSVIFVLFFGTFTCLMVPATFISISAGVIFRPMILSVIIILLGSQAGLLLAFSLGRTVLRPWIEKRVRSDPSLTAIDAALSREGWKIVLLLRLSPIVPFGLCNYLLSLTSMQMYAVMFATLLGNIPGATLYSFIGSIVGSLAGAEKVEIDLRTKLITILFSLVFLVGSVVFITVVAKRALREATLSYTPIESDGEGLGSASEDDEESLSPSVRQDATLPDEDEISSRMPTNDSSPSRGRRRQVSATPVQEDVEAVPRAPRGAYTAEEQKLLAWTFGGMGIVVVVGLPLIFLLT